MPPPVFRFAPSPNGYLHLGHAYSALLNFDLARQAGGRFLLRIEDIDATRCRPEFEAAIYEDLAWLGIAWEQPVRRQSEHFAIYREAVERLVGRGAGLSELREPRRDRTAGRAARGRRRRGRAIPTARRSIPARRSRCPLTSATRLIESGAPYALRLDMAAACARAGDLGWIERGEGPDGETGAVAARPEAWGDVILARKETPTSYHLSVVIDDALQGVTEVVRGRDLFWSTSVHRLLQVLLGLPQPAYRHHRLVLDAAGQKLSKSTGATGLRELRAARRDAGRYPPPGRACLDRPRAACGLERKWKRPASVTLGGHAMACWAGRVGGIMASKPRSQRTATAAETAAAEEARCQSCRRKPRPKRAAKRAAVRSRPAWSRPRLPRSRMRSARR